MTIFRKTGDRAKYDFLDARCIEATCFQPGHFQVRGATGASGSRNTGAERPCCMRRAYHGCPNEADRGYDPESAKKRRNEGWRKA